MELNRPIIYGTGVACYAIYACMVNSDPKARKCAVITTAVALAAIAYGAFAYE